MNTRFASHQVIAPVIAAVGVGGPACGSETDDGLATCEQALTEAEFGVDEIDAVCGAMPTDLSGKADSVPFWKWRPKRRRATFAHPDFPDKASCSISHLDTDGDGCFDTGFWPLEFMEDSVDCPGDDCPYPAGDHTSCIAHYYALTGCDEPVPDMFGSR